MFLIDECLRDLQCLHLSHRLTVPLALLRHLLAWATLAHGSDLSLQERAAVALLGAALSAFLSDTV